MNRWKAITLLFSLSACAKHPANDGDWENKLARYEQEYARNPRETALAKKIENATAKVIEAHAAKGARARQQGWMLEAGAHWGRALALCTPRVDPPACGEVGNALRRDASAIELSADEAAKQGRYEAAAEAYDAILLVAPDRVGVAEKNVAVERSFAASLQERADDLQRRRMLGAAWAMNVRALSHDPMQPDAFRAGSALEKSMRSRAKVAVQDVTVNAKKGQRVFGNAIARSIRPRLDDVKPYGPTRDPKAVKARFTARIVKIDQRDSTVDGIEQRKNEDKTKIPNPAVAAQKKKVARLQASLATLQKGKRTPKKARKIEAARKDLRAAKTALAALPATIRPPATFDLAWQEVTRTVEATVRFELHEPDMDEPLVLELTRRVERSDRTHKGDAKRGVLADPLTLPSHDALTAELAGSFGEGATLLETARERRIATRLEKGKAHLAAGRTEAALDSFVEVLFLAGPSALGDAEAAFVARSMERDEVETLLASNQL